MSWNVFIIGHDELSKQMLTNLRHLEDYAFHELLSLDEVVHAEEYRFAQLVDDALAQLERFPGPVDAIVGYWDFPTSGLLPVLRRERGLPGPSLEAFHKCEHKYWSRLEQARAVPECVPAFQALDPFDERAVEAVEIDYPFWIKPVKAHSSHLGFRIENADQLREVLPVIRRGIGRFGRPFDEVTTLAELPEEVQTWMLAITRCFLARVGYDDAPFNIEYFLDEQTDRIWLLEINARISRSHAGIFQLVDGAPHFQVMVDVALGIPPRLPHREGRYPVAAKQMLRVFEDGWVRRVPSDEEIRGVEQAFPDTLVQLNVREGMRLSELMHQDPCSWELGVLFTGAQTREALTERLEQCRRMLPFEIEPLSSQAPHCALGTHEGGHHARRNRLSPPGRVPGSRLDSHGRRSRAVRPALAAGRRRAGPGAGHPRIYPLPPARRLRAA